MGKIILGLIMAAAGALMTIKSEAMLTTFGRIGFFEKYLGLEGGSRLGYKLLGLLTVFFGTLIFTGLIDGFLRSVMSPLIRVTTF